MKKIIAVFLLSAQFVFAHGEDQPGPHGGFVQMPGAFHTEVVSMSKNKVKVYLLDIDWKNPSVEKSSVTASIGRAKAICTVKVNFYDCVFPSAVNLNKKGQLKIAAEREGQIGAEAIYDLPLSFKER